MIARSTGWKRLTVLAGVVMLLFQTSGIVHAAMPQAITYQGKLTDSSGAAINAVVDLAFALYSSETASAPSWTELQSGVNVSLGLFTVELGSHTPLDLSLFSHPELWLGISADGEPEMTPRQKLSSVPFAMKAAVAEAVAGGSVDAVSLASGAITPDKLADVCAEGEVLAKSGSSWVCRPPVLLATCYDGDFVSCYGAAPSTIGVGVCKAGVRVCSANTFSAVCAGEVTPVVETCDGRDEDCNGLVDDAPGAPTWYVDTDGDSFGDAGKPVVACNKPAGYVSNSTDCNDEKGFVNPFSPELCDSLDNDCNGLMDDSCVTAACTGDEQSQVFECGAECGGSDMICIADCLDRMGLTVECHDSVTTLGMCVYNIGDPACFTNIACWRQTCSAEYGAAFGPECKSGVTRSCGPGTEVGVCQSGTETCVSGFWSGVCAGAVYQAGEVCDGLDNDCNGVADENPAAICGSDGSCVSGACQCSGGFTACSSQCVNTNDDMFNCGSCGNDCLAAVPDGADTFCSSGTCQYMCMGGRDDCNGTMADGCETDLWSDTANCGACGNDCASQVGANATPACDGAMCRAVCNSGFEDCNGDPVDGCEADLSNDPNNCGWCNNPADDGNVCNGAETCVSGTVSSGAPLSCDDGVSCTADFCDSSVGCVHTAHDFACDDGNVCTSDYCDASNGCIGAPFDAPIGDGCATGLQGVCAAGVTACSGGTIACVQNNLPSTEVCDGSDNDCDGFVDNGNPGGGYACSTGYPGVCSEGLLTCTSGVLMCQQTNSPTAEVCNELDDDCDGQADEGGVCAVCGDSIVSGDEQCDDGDTMSGDGCQSTCVVEPGYLCSGSPSVCQTLCGDGISAGSEQCDDGDTMSGDGCQSTCVVEPGYQCSGSPSVCQTVCGDGIVSGSEQCDDGDTMSGDGCQSTCVEEPGYQCSGSPSVCQTLCGDGISAGSEQCDDGNTSNADSCTNVCTLPACGDGIVTVSIGEQCDDGNVVNTDSCTDTCTLPTCSDSMQNGDETGVDCGGSCGLCPGTCNTAADCSGSDTVCGTKVCQSNACVWAYSPAGTTCRPSAGACDVEEECTGSSEVCPVDQFQSSTYVCRASAGVCDVGEYCTGASAACPGDGYQSDGTACDDGNSGTSNDICTSGLCQGITAVAVDWCNLQWPQTVTVLVDDTLSIYGRVYVNGLTDQTTLNDLDANLVASVGYGPDGTDPSIDSGWLWVSANANPVWDGAMLGVPNDDEYVGSFSISSTGVYDMAYRFSYDGGNTWTYCDSNSGDGYQPANAGSITVQ